MTTLSHTSSRHQQPDHSARRNRRLKRIDRAAVAIITAGGIAVVLAVFGILVFIAAEAVPLFRSATMAPAGGPLSPRGGSPVPGVLGTDEYERFVYDVTTDGRLRF